ncbi:hypothetical protein BC351_22325 [Paenibacillus ferrarius]|uniref:Uncharacterized protein n=1 Tax=Paenibacillus ferrarius TaxID=1469647 RepID=A0A1V4HMY8_9BACL|nr:hypothetical protein BC351_22325 [Paenibacillus ferrarius]
MRVSLPFSPARGGAAGSLLVSLLFWQAQHTLRADSVFSRAETAFFAGSGRGGGFIASEPAFLAGSAYLARGFGLFAR